jgi:group I intron endonuclease
MRTGIYIIVNLINNKFYIGSASYSLVQRISHHFQDLRKNKHFNRHLQSAYNKYGEDNFVAFEIEYCSPEKCLDREQYYLDTYNPDYNIQKVARSPLGVKRSEETKKKLSESAKGRKWSQEYKDLFRRRRLEYNNK